MTKPLTAITVVAVFILLASGCSQNGEFTLRYKLTPGRTLTYTHQANRSYRIIAGDSIIDSGSGEYTMTIVTHVERLIDDSTAEISERHRWVEAKRDSADSSKVDSVWQERNLTMQSMSNGRISNIQFSADENVMQSIWTQNVAEQGTPVFPALKLGIGDDWTQTSRIKVGDSEQEASTTYRVVGFMQDNGYKCAVVKYGGNMILPVVENPSDTTRRSGIDRVSTDGTLYFAPDQGVLVRQKEHWTIAGERRKLNNGEFMNYSVTVTMDLETRLTDTSGVAATPASSQ